MSPRFTHVPTCNQESTKHHRLVVQANPISAPAQVSPPPNPTHRAFFPGPSRPSRHSSVKDPRVHGLISITAVETTPDLKYAKVHVSVLDKSDVDQVIKGLKSAAGYLRRELGAALSLRATPELTFLRDDSIDKGAHILEIIESLDK